MQEEHGLKDVTKAFFFKAMLQGWAGEGIITKPCDWPGYKVLRFEEDKFILIDSYCVAGKSHSPKSTGTTTIWYDGTPVWWMSYGGFYEKSAIPLLKEALLSAYGAGVFMGGRGFSAFRHGSMMYINHAETNDFSSFRGREEIIEIASCSYLGEHEYWGMSLIHNW